MTTPRTIAIGDIHGCHAPFQDLLESLKVQPEDTIVFLGDAVDRGPDSRRVIETLLELKDRCQLVAILGNHEEMLLDAVDGSIPLHDWLVHGGAETLDSYGKGMAPSRLPAEHVDYIRTWVDYYETTRWEIASQFSAAGPLLRQNRDLGTHLK